MNNALIYLIGFLSPFVLFLIAILIFELGSRIGALINDRKSVTSKWLWRYYSRVTYMPKDEWRERTLKSLDEFIEGNKL